jgi:hypothetical protein
MAWSSPAALALALGIITSSANILGCQQLHALEAGVQQPTESVSGSQPSAVSVIRQGAAWGTLGSVLGGVGGFVADQAYCNSHNSKERSSLVAPCFVPIGEGSAIGWFGGAAVGATLGAARLAQKRGCPRRAAILRALAGAALGSAPGLIVIAQRPRNYPPPRSLIIAGTPILAGIGAAAAVIGCHAA